MPCSVVEYQHFRGPG